MRVLGRTYRDGDVPTPILSCSRIRFTFSRILFGFRLENLALSDFDFVADSYSDSESDSTSAGSAPLNGFALGLLFPLSICHLPILDLGSGENFSNISRDSAFYLFLSSSAAAALYN